MAVVGFKLETGTVVPRLAEIARGLTDATRMWDEIGGKLELSTHNRFDTGTDPEGALWPKSLRVINQGGKTLVDSARLYQSVTHNAWPSGVAVGTNVEFAATHQFGATIKAKTAKGLFIKFKHRGSNKSEIRRPQQVTIPRRAFLGLSDADETEIMTIAERYVARISDAH